MKSLSVLITLLILPIVQAMESSSDREQYAVANEIEKKVTGCFKHSKMDNIITCLSKAKEDLKKLSQQITSATVKNNVNNKLKANIRNRALEKSISAIHPDPIEVIDKILDDLFGKRPTSGTEDKGKEWVKAEEGASALEPELWIRKSKVIRNGWL